MKKNILTLMVLMSFFGLINFGIAGGLQNPLKADSFEALINLIINFLWDFGLVLAVLVLMIGALHILMSRGDPEKFNKGKKVMLYAVFGLLLIIIARGLIVMIIDLFT